jgi:uncharacterized protein YdeI (YjbR/CyaY-like superfamily)
MGDGEFILPINAAMRKGTKKQQGASLQIQLEVDVEELKPSAELMECLADEPEAEAKFKSLPKGHQNYFSNWIKSAKTEPTKAKRIAHTIKFLSKGKDFGEMLRALKKEREESL